MNINFVCNYSWILGDVPHQIWEAQTADGSANTLLTRFFHNKLAFYLNNFARCYFSYLSPDFLTKAFTLIGLILFIVGLYFAISQRKHLLLILICLAPIFALLDIPSVLYVIQSLVILSGAYEIIKFIRSKK
ncbi:hypothetical protein HY085_00650 [Candidatus Gottesmanbacteria bacterium]|nr:hypothetical protein [Candidatus Gottesmanbacteria bacterium]